MTWTDVLEDASLGEGGLAPVYPLGLNLVLARVGGVAYALSGRCAHLGCPLFTGQLDGHTLTCGCHDWRFDVRTGRFLDAPELGVQVYPTRSDAGRLLVGLDSKGGTS
jgi:nitrite reductase/ring-hydroxylating ferredoxin subunit